MIHLSFINTYKGVIKTAIKINTIGILVHYSDHNRQDGSTPLWLPFSFYHLINWTSNFDLCSSIHNICKRNSLLCSCQTNK